MIPAEDIPDLTDPPQQFQERAGVAYREFVKKEHEQWLMRVFK